MTGGSSKFCSQPIGGDDGGEIRNVFVFLGGSKYGLVFFSLIGLKNRFI
jgi:hypothetical protein